MKLRILGVLCLICVVPMSAAFASQNLAPSISAGIDVNSAYVWRGYERTDNITVQPNVNFAFGNSGFNLNLWTNYAAQDRDVAKAADELDITASYTNEFSNGSMEWSAGFIQYSYMEAPSENDNTQEAFFGLCSKSSWSPRMAAHYDFGFVDGMYVSAGVAPSWPMSASGNTMFQASASVAGSDRSRDFGFHDATMKAGVSMMTGQLTVTPNVGYSLADKEINPDEGAFWGGVNFDIQF